MKGASWLAFAGSESETELLCVLSGQHSHFQENESVPSREWKQSRKIESQEGSFPLVSEGSLWQHGWKTCSLQPGNKDESCFQNSTRE